MGKKNTANTLPLRESLRKASSTLERHIYRKHQTAIRQTLAHAQVSAQTINLGYDLIRETNLQAQLQQAVKSVDSEQLRKKIKEKERLPSEFEEKLQFSQESYQNCMKIFKAGSLRQKYRHLLPGENSQEETVSSIMELSEDEENSFERLKALYSRYRVSNMWKVQVCQKIGKKQVEKLILKGVIKEHRFKEQKAIISLIC